MIRKEDQFLWGIKFEDAEGNIILATRNRDHPDATSWPGFEFKEIILNANERLLGIKSAFRGETPAHHYDFQFVVGKKIK